MKNKFFIIFLSLFLSVFITAGSFDTTVPLGSRNVVRSSLATGTNSGATATNAAVSGKKHYFQRIVGYTDTTSNIEVRDGSTAIYKIKITAGSFDIVADGLYVGTTNTAMNAVIISSTSECWINLVTEVY
jgi:hypothetical protein